MDADAKGAPQGLSQEEALARLQRDGPNSLPEQEHMTLWRIARGVLFEPMFLLLLVAGGLYLALGDTAEALFLLASVAMVVAITVSQERKTERALEALRELSAPSAHVVRDGLERSLPSAEVVVGDLLSLREGDRVPADAQLRTGSVEADESMLTGESTPVPKLSAPGESTVYAGTLLTRGRALAVVTAIGAATAAGLIGRDLAMTQQVVPALQQASRRFVRAFALAGLASAVALWLVSWLWDKHPLLDSLLAGIALAMAMLPEEFPVVLTVFLALGAWRIARCKVLARRISAVEALGAITVLAVDKTGTLTQNRMQVAECFADGVGADVRKSLPTSLMDVLRLAVRASPMDSNDPMEHAIHALGRERLALSEYAVCGSDPIREYSLETTLPCMSRVFDQGDGSFLVSAKGAPESIMSLCRLDRSARDDLMREVDAMARRGLRVLGIACATWSGASLPDAQHGFAYRFVGLVGMEDPPRHDVADAMDECCNAGIRVVMMTGDHPVTAAAIAREVRLSPQPNVLTGDDLESLDDADLRRRLSGIDVFARVRPAQKLRLVEAMQREGHVVGMTGDGVNDAPALKAADVGVAMGAHGTDVARGAAALILLDDSFSSLVVAIREGRRIYDNIVKAFRFIVAVHVPIVAFALVPPILHWPVVVMPVQIVLLELIIDPACSVVFESTRASPGVMRKPPRLPGDSPFSAANLVQGVLQGIGVAMILLAAYRIALVLADEQQARAASFLGLLFTVVMLVLASHDPSRMLIHAFRTNRRLLPMLFAVAGLAITVLSIPLLRRMVGIDLPGTQTVALVAAVLVANMAWLEIVRWLERSIQQSRRSTHHQHRNA
ncbi:MAG: cation-translocating P-type ATPase [Luteibacter sp.]